jgi:O-antigen ligase
VSFLYPLLNFLQPGILWPDLSEYRPMLVASLLALGVGLLRWPRSATKEVFSHRSFFWLTVFILAQVISVYFGGVMGMIEEFLFWGPYLLFVVVSVLLISDANHLRRYVWGMIAGGMFIVVYGIYAVYAGLGLGITGRAGAYGMYQNHNDYSFIVLQILPFVFTYMRAESTMFRRTLLAVSFVVCVIGIFMSMSRGAVLILVLEAVMIIVFAMQGRRRLLWLPVIAVLGTVAVAYQYQQRSENQGDQYTVEDAENSRYELWRAGIVMIKEHPLLGVGSRRFGEVARDYYELSGSQIGKNSHNTFIEILSTSGVFGFVPFMLMAYYMLRDLRRHGRGGKDPMLDATVIATFISLFGILCRSYLDAKPDDWSFFVLCAIGLSCCALRNGVEGSTGSGHSEADAKRHSQVGQLQDAVQSVSPTVNHGYGHGHHHTVRDSIAGRGR